MTEMQRHDSESEESYQARLRYVEAKRIINKLWSASADKMWSECRRDEWQMAPHPILLERGRDHG